MNRPRQLPHRSGIFSLAALLVTWFALGLGSLPAQQANQGAPDQRKALVYRLATNDSIRVEIGRAHV